MSYTGCMDERLRRHGRGTYTYRNAFFKYTGAWVRGKKDGPGTLVLGPAGDGSTVEGTFRDGELTGYGKRVSALSGVTYEGDFVEGEACGQGRTWSALTGEKYVGGFLNNRRHGEGELTSPDGAVYQGLFENHRKNGAGCEYLPGGTTFQGAFRLGRRHGDGVLTYAGGECLEATWNDGAVDAAVPGEAKFKDPAAGYTYDGAWSAADGTPMAAAAGPVAPRGTGIEAPEPEDDGGDAAAAAAAAADAVATPQWVAELAPGDKVVDWSFAVSTAVKGVDVAGTGRVLRLTAWLLADPQAGNGDADAAAATGEDGDVADGGSGETDPADAFPRQVALFRDCAAVAAAEAAAAEADAAADVDAGGSAVAGAGVEATLEVTLPVGEGGVAALPEMEVVAGAEMGTYDIRVEDATPLGPGSLELGFQLAETCAIRLTLGGSSGGSKKKKKKKK